MKKERTNKRKSKTVTTKTEMAQNLDVASTDGSVRYDAAARNLVAQKPVLAYILKSALEEYADYSVQEIAENFIEGTPEVRKIAVHPNHPDKKDDSEMMSGDDKIAGAPTEDTSQTDGTVFFDIRFVALLPKSKGFIEIFVNVEVQNNDTPGYPIPKRGIYYGSRMISSQRGKVFTNQEYGKIKKVVSIWLCQSAFGSKADTMNRYSIKEECLRGHFHEKKKNYDLMTVVVMRLGNKGESSEDNAIRLLSKMFSMHLKYEEKIDMLENEFKISMSKEIDREVWEVCNLSEGVYNRGYDKGYDTGYGSGYDKGLIVNLISLVCRNIQRGKSVAEMADWLAEPEEVIQNICDIAQSYAPDYDVEKIYADYCERADAVSV